MANSTAHPNHQLISSEDVEGTEVYGAGDENVGEIDHLIIDKLSGRVIYAVMSFGGFLGLGHSHYPVPWAALKYDTSLGGFRTGITEQQLSRTCRVSRVGRRSRFACYARARQPSRPSPPIWRRDLQSRLGLPPAGIAQRAEVWLGVMPRCF